MLMEQLLASDRTVLQMLQQRCAQELTMSCRLLTADVHRPGLLVEECKAFQQQSLACFVQIC
jgi:hypothetical protein